MDDNARGMASKILCDLLNIPKGGNTVATDGTYLARFMTILKSLLHCFYLCTKDKIKPWNSEYSREHLSVHKD